MRKYLLIFAFCILHGNAFADSQTAQLADEIELIFPPRQAHYVIHIAPSTDVVMPGKIYQKTDSKGGFLATIATSFAVPENATEVEYKIVVEGGDRELYETPLQKLPVFENGPERATEQDLKSRVEKEREKLSVLEAQTKNFTKELEALEVRVDKAGNIMTLVKLEEQIEATKSDLSRFAKSVEGARADVSLMKSIPNPRNYRLRENELSDAVRLMGGPKEQEGPEKPDDLSSKMSLIEENKFEQVDRLTRELERLRKERAGLERGLRE